MMDGQTDGLTDGRRPLQYPHPCFKKAWGLLKLNSPASNFGYLASPRTIFHGCQIVYLDLLDAKRRCPKNGLGYVKVNGFHGNP